jgi:alpha-L-fucosidase 2
LHDGEAAYENLLALLRKSTLPEAWPDGHIHGLCARGGFEVNIDWKNGKLEKATIFSKLGNDCTIRYGEKVITTQTTKGGKYEFDGKPGSL